MPETNELLRLLPMLKGIPAACLLALVLVGPLDLGGLTRATGYTRGKVQGALGMLETLGLVISAGEAWSTRHSLAASHSLADFAAPVSAQGESSLESRSESLNPDFSSVTKLDSEVKKTQEMGAVEIEKILACAEGLFGEPVYLGAGVEVDAPRLLGLLAEAYANRSHLRKPARVVAANLRAGRSPSLRYQAQFRAYLPAEFLRTLDQQLSVAPEAEGAGGEGDAGPDAPGASEPTPEPSESERLWRAAREELQLSLPKASFESYVQPLAALDYDPQQRQLFLEAPDGPSCRWLDGHLKRILERLMVGITGEAVEVVFLPPEEPGAPVSGAPDAGAGGAA